VGLGANSSYLALGKRTPVYGSDGDFIGVVKKVECDRKNDIFDGLLVSTPAGDRYLIAEQVAAVHEHGVEARITSREALGLPDVKGAPTVPSEGLGQEPDSWADHRHWLAARFGVGQVDDPRLHAAEERLLRRRRALELARENPALAVEAGVGRPDVRGAFHGEVVDVNNASAPAIAGLPGVGRRLASRIVRVREEVGGFSSLEELGMLLDLPGDEVERLRGLVVFLPLGR
jgi:hypothetical protein